MNRYKQPKTEIREGGGARKGRRVTGDRTEGKRGAGATGLTGLSSTCEV